MFTHGLPIVINFISVANSFSITKRSLISSRLGCVMLSSIRKDFESKTGIIEMHALRLLGKLLTGLGCGFSTHLHTVTLAMSMELK